MVTEPRLAAFLTGEGNYHVAQGDCRAVLRALPEESVHCVVTSPPYWGLRDYGMEGQLGLEPTFDQYLDVMVGVFGEVRRVLRSDGTLWLNMGDCYVSNSPGSGPPASSGAKLKDKLLQPHRLAIALCDAGWWVRQDNVWHKRNPMPEAVEDRTTTAHEYVFHLAKSPSYFYDAVAVREPVSGTAHARRSAAASRFPAEAERTEHRRRKLAAPGNGIKANTDFEAQTGGLLVSERNRRSVWTITSEPFRDAHFATFPPRLVEPCILAGTSAGGACATCGSPLTRQLGAAVRLPGQGSGNKQRKVNDRGRSSHVGSSVPWQPEGRATTGWARSCECDPGGTKPCVVLDPFAGAATTGLVALQQGRRFVGIELKPEYVAMAERRLSAWKGQQRLGEYGLARWGDAE